jgi:hypothetical protein
MAVEMATTSSDPTPNPGIVVLAALSQCGIEEGPCSSGH